ncbi:MAG: hypothetical protein ACKN9T_11850 [Candidatus Methylumidiphilus sp.]
MNIKPVHRQYWALGLLAMLMAVTRFHHEGSAFALPDASLAVFYLGGLYLPSRRDFIALLALAAVVDYLAINSLGVSAYCMSPAYLFMIPTYGLMWLAGAWFSRQPHTALTAQASQFAGSVMLSASLAFLVSNGSFFWFSGKVSAVSLIEYARGLSGFYIPYLGAAAGYAVLGLALVGVLRAVAIQVSAKPKLS